MGFEVNLTFLLHGNAGIVLPINAASMSAITIKSHPLERPAKVRLRLIE
jgi:hypothetical protein